MKHDSFAARIAAAYFIVALVWIILSDDLIRGIARSPAQMTVLQSAKGAAFVVATTVVLYLFVSRKIHQLEATRQMLADSAAYNELLMAHAADGLLILTTDGKIVSASETFTELTGYSANELVGANISIIIPPEDMISNPPRNQEVAAKGGQVVKIERRVRRKDGSTLHTEWHSKLLPNGLIQGMMRDISERLEAEAAIRRHAERLQVLAEATGAFTEATDDYTRLGQIIVSRLADVIGDACGIWIASGDDERINLLASHIGNSELDTELQVNTSDLYFIRGEGAIGQVFETGQALLVEHVPIERRQNRTVARWQSIFQAMPIFSMIYVPVRAFGRPLGVLALARTRPDRALYNEDDLRLTQEIADRAGLAISNAQSFQVAQRELAVRIEAETAARRNATRLQLLTEVTSAFTEAADNYVGLAETVVHRIAETIGDSCLLCLANETGDRIAPIASYSIDPEQDAMIRQISEGTYFTPGKGPAGQVYSTGKPLLVVEKVDEVLKTVLPVWTSFFAVVSALSILYVPIRARGTRLGVLILLHSNPQRAVYTEDDLHLAQDLADRAGLAISNAQLLQTAQRELAERIEAEHALHESERRFRTVADTFPMLIWMLDANGGLVYINRSWTTYTGRPVEDALGWGWGDLMHPDDREDLADTVTGFARQGEPFSVDFRLRRHDGEYRWMLSTGTPRYNNEGEFAGFVGSSVDLTERHEAQTALQALNDDLERRVAERTAELTAANERLRELDHMRSKFVAHVTHDLRNPVASLSMRLYIMPRSPERYAEHVEVLTEQVDRLKHLIDSVLDLSRIDLGRSTVQFEPVNLNAIVEDEVLALSMHAKDVGLELICQVDNQDAQIWGVPNQIAQVVANLVGNAIHYTPSGTVEVTTEFDAGQQMNVLRVRDTGLGIASEDIPHLFERFYRGQTVIEAEMPGSGLGLSIVKEVVDIHHGRVEVDSEVGKGTTFSVWLPVAPLTINLNS